MKYIDFDEVILNTGEVLVKNYTKKEMKETLTYFNDDDYIKKYDWNKLIDESVVINNAVNIIKSFNKNEVAIISKILTLDNEGVAKINFIRSMGIECNIILVPEHSKKTDVVNAENNILVDDSLRNLDDWEKAGGKGIFFDRFHTNIDVWGNKNVKYESTDTLEILKKY